MWCVWLTQDGTECGKPGESLRSHPGGRGRRCWAAGQAAPGCSAGGQTALSLLQNSTEPAGAANAEWAKSTEHGEPECDCSKGPGPCAFPGVTRLGPRRGKEGALSGRGAGWAHIWANGNSVQSSPKPERGQMQTVDTEKKRTKEYSKLNETLRSITASFWVLNVSPGKNFPKVALFW